MAAAASMPISPNPSYRSYYDAEENDRHRDAAGAVFAQYETPPAGGGLDAVSLSRVILASADRVPVAHVLLCARPGGIPKVKLFHRLVEFPARLGLPATPWDNKAYACKGELIRGQITTVEWKPDYHEPTNVIRLPNQELANAALDADPNLELIPEYAAATAGTRLVRTRKSMFVPQRFVPLMLEKDLTPREAYTLLVGAIENQGMTAACGPLITWLLAALTSWGAVAPLQVDDPEVPLADADLIEHRWLILERDLPELSPTAVAVGAQAIASNIGALAAEQRQARLEEATRAAERKAKTTPEEFFGPGIVYLMRWCQVATAKDLPPYYAKLAGAPKKQQVPVLQAAVDQVSFGAPFLIMPSLSKKVVGLEWASYDPDDLTLGITPFTVPYLTSQQKIAQQGRVDAYQMIMQGQSAPALSDAYFLTAPDEVVVPQTFPHARYTLMQYAAVLMVALGQNHPVATEVGLLVQQIQLREQRLEEMPPPAGHAKVDVPALILRYVQLRINNWAANQRARDDAVPPPNLHALLDRIDIGEPWAPPIPSRYLRIPRQPVAPPTAPVPRAPVTSPPAQATPGPQGGAATDTEGHTMVRNTQPDPRFDPFHAMTGITSRNLYRTAEGNLPKRDTAHGAGERCLSFHVKHMCNTRCRRNADHTNDHTEDEQAALLTWCQEHYHA